MDTVINRLSEIEDAASSILDAAAVRKKTFAKDMEEKTAAFDKGLEAETAKRISDIQRQMEEEMEALLARQTRDAKAFQKHLEENYMEFHKTYVNTLFDQMVKE